MVLGLALVSLVALSNAQGCNSLTEMYGLSGEIIFGNTSLGAVCVRIIPQPSNKAKEVRVIDVQIDPSFQIGDAQLTVYSTWFPTDVERQTVASYTDCCDSNMHLAIKSPVITVVFNTSNYQDIPFYVRYASRPETRTKFSMGLFQGVIVAIGLPVVSLLISWCTFRRGMCDKAGKHRRLSRKSPFAERVMTLIFSGVGMLFFFLLTFRVFG